MIDMQRARALTIRVADNELICELIDGRTIITPLAWFPRLQHGTTDECSNWRLIGNGIGIHWPDLDEDISVDGLLAGQPSDESQKSLKLWLTARKPTQPNKRIPRNR